MKIHNYFNSKGKMRLLTSLLFLFLLSSTSLVYAQKITVSGTVTSADDGMAIPGVTVMFKGTNIGTTTDFDGNYTILANKGDVLVFNFLGMATKSLKVTTNTLNVEMSSDIEDLDEVVVIGYGSMKKKELTGAVSRVKAEEIQEFVSQDLASTLQGQVAGVNITASSGEPGEQSSIQIRGITSLGGSNTPLFVVDGIPQEGDPGLNPNEIETIDILKDAASAAVYGTRGAAGVILITTKKGKAGNMRISLDASQGFSFLGEGVPLMNTEEKIFYELVKKRENTPDSFEPGPNRNPDWLNNDNKFDDYVLVDGAETRRYNLNFSGGTKDFSYNVVGGYFDQEGTLLNSGFKRYNGRANASYNTNKWKLNSSISFTTDDRKRSSTGLIVNAIRYPSYFPQIDPDADVIYTNNIGATAVNGFAISLKRKDRQRSDRINASLGVTYNFTDDFSFTTRMGTAITNTTRNIFIPQFTSIDVDDDIIDRDPTKSQVTAFAQRRITASLDGSFNYKKTLGDHSFSGLLSFTYDTNSREEFTATRQGVANNNIQVLNGANINPDAFSGFNYTNKNFGILGRIQYNYKGKYLFSSLIRRDGSSKFSLENRWGIFPSVSAGWVVSEESFWEPIKATVNNFKVRLSRGTVGNESFPAYEYAATIAQGTDYIFDTTDTSVDFGSAIKSYANPLVRWETSIQENIGIDLAFLKNKITFTADYYKTQKNNMLLPDRLPGSAGAYYDNTRTLNVGDMTNKGMELALRWRDKIGRSRINIGTTFTRNKNTITRLSGNNDLYYNPGSALINGDNGSVVTTLAKGYEVGSYFLYETNGVIQTIEQRDEYRKFPTRTNARLGDLIYVDTNGDGDITEEDRKYVGSGLPDFEIGMNFKWMYKNWDLTMNWYGTVGSEIVNGTRAAAYTFGNHRDLVNMWSSNNTTSNIPLHTGDSKSGEYNYRGFTDQWVENGDYIRLKLISLGYTIPKRITQKFNVNSLKLFVSGQNTLTLTNYKGYDPEIGGNVVRRGLDVSRYPLAALYTFGVKLRF